MVECPDNPPSREDRRRCATFRFYEELNDFLPRHLRKVSFAYTFNGTPSVKDAIEAIGVPHTEVDLILVDGTSVGFERLLAGGERVSVYPMFERLDIAPATRLRPRPLREPRFVLDVHLGKLARYLRLTGFDALYDSHYDDADIVRLASGNGRIILTRDRGLLKRREVTHGYWVRNVEPRRQLEEVVASLDLRSRVHPFSRCMLCNDLLQRVDENSVRDELPPRVRGRFLELARCPTCARLYWPGSHFAKLTRVVEGL
jgi:uncharacterized protein with PIN domain